ncbi:uncharacterized protein LOC128550923 isoform X1 [Mercenaria mercenaria]|uniref:uncharacterized protein LOC128550923 isoform X1 n=1 Tax=Mercenaria mercenaria TaxID=6596 RepID=UPI00234F43CE|nr:uncharacterized protein LOC128550923 isoform X1 [Mercenaria mercenaria]
MLPRKRARTSQRAPHTSSSDGNKGPSDQATPKSGQPKSQQTPPSPPNRKRQQTQPAPPNRSEGHVDSPGQSVDKTQSSTAPLRGPGALSSSGVLPPAVEGEIDRLISASLSQNTQKRYRSAIESFTNFCINSYVELNWPPTVEQITEYIAFMSLRQYSHSSVNCHISAISYVNKLNGLLDNTKQFIVRSMLEGLKRLKTNTDTRQPITQSVLLKLLDSLTHVCRSQFEAMLFTAAFSLAYIGLLRISEFTSSNKTTTSGVLKFQDVIIGSNKIRIYLQKSKTDQTGTGTSVDIEISDKNKFCCENIANYIAFRPNTDGPFFVHFDESPLTSFQFNAVLRKAIKFAGLDANLYKSHSFRIGGATSMFRDGTSINNIKSQGRWKSDSYKSYIR